MQADEICGTYSISHLNGKKAPSKATLCLSREGEEINVFLKVHNTLRGKVQFSENEIKGMLLSTMLVGDENQMAVEDAISSGISEGFIVKKEGKQMLLKGASNSITFVRKAGIEELFGTHAIISIDDEPCSAEMTIRFTSDENGGCFVVANVGNSLRGHCQLINGTLTGDLATTWMEADPSLAVFEPKITKGMQEGFAVERNDVGFVLQSSVTHIQLCRLVTAKDLLGEFQLKEFNRAPVVTENQCTITFGVDEENEKIVQIFIVVANRIRGAATLEKNVLISDEPLMSTRMMGSEFESQLEAAYNAGFQYGLEAILIGSTLVLKDEENTFTYTRIVPVETTNEGPTYKGTQVTKCFKTEGNGLLFRIVNEVEKKWAFYNDSADYRIFVSATFGTRSEIEPLNNATVTEEEGKKTVRVTVEPLTTEMFVSGTVNGFQIVYDAIPAADGDAQPPADKPNENGEADPHREL